MTKRAKHIILMLVGALIYYECELNWRYLVDTLPVHWTMPLLGGVMFVLIGGLNEFIPWEMNIESQIVIGCLIVTAAEFVCGVVLNIILGLNVWDYSHLPFNILGQICIPFMGFWLILSAVAILLDDWLRYKLFGEEKPHYSSALLKSFGR